MKGEKKNSEGKWRKILQIPPSITSFLNIHTSITIQLTDVKLFQLLYIFSLLPPRTRIVKDFVFLTLHLVDTISSLCVSMSLA